MPSKPLASVVEELKSAAAADARAELALTACELLDPPCVEIGWQLVEAAMKLGAENPKNRFHRIVEDSYDKLKPDFKTLSPPQRAAVLKAVCGELGDATAAAWEHMADFQYGLSYLSMAFRSPSTRDANFDRLYAWLKDIVSILYTFPVGLVTPEWIAVHAGGIEDPTRMFYSGLDGVLGDGDSPQDAFGTLLGSVIAGDNESSDNVFETLSLIANGEHPVGVVNSYLFRALWRSGQYRCYEVLTGLIAGIADEGSVESAMVIALIVHSARESGPIAMGIAIESVLTHRVLMQDHVAVVIGSWIKVPLEKKSESERYEIVRQLLESLQNLEQLKANVASADISGRDAGLLLFAQAYEDTAAIPELAGQLYQRVPADDRTEFAMALARIETPPEVEPNADVWLSLVMDDDLSASAPILLYSPRAPKCDPEKLWAALEQFADNLPLELDADAPLIPGDDKSRLKDLRQKLADLAYGIADGMPTERLVKILSWTIRGLKWKFWEPPEAFSSILNAIDLSDVAVREIVVETVCEDSYLASVLAPDLIRVGLKDSDRQWLVPLLRDNYISQELIDASLEIPSQQLIDILINPLLTDEDKNERLRGCTFLRWICAKTENPPDWIATEAEKLLSDRLKDVRLAGLKVLNGLAEKDQLQQLVADAIVRHSQKKKLTDAEEWRMKHIRKLLPVEVLREAKKKTEDATPKDSPTEKATETPAKTLPVPPVVPPQERPDYTPDVALIRKCISGISELIEQHKSLMTHVSDLYENQNGPLHKVSLGGVVTEGYGTQQRVNEQFPHREIWEQWYEDPAQASIREAGIPAIIYTLGIPRDGLGDKKKSGRSLDNLDSYEWMIKLLAETPKHVGNAVSVVRWLALQNPSEETATIFVDRVESLLASIPTTYWEQLADPLSTTVTQSLRVSGGSSD